MRAVWSVVRREYLQRVRSRWFLVSTLGGPVLLLGALAVPAVLAPGSSNVAVRTLAVVDGTDALYERVAPDLAAAGFITEEVRWTSTVVDTLRRRARDGELGAFLLLDQFTLEAGDAVLYARVPPSALQRTAISSAVVRAALEVQLEQRGVDVAAMLSAAGLDVQPLGAPGAEPDEPRLLAAYLGAFVLYMVILLYAVAVMRATLEEKTSRIVEIVISAMKPWHLMLGKILGVGSVGLTQMAVWVSVTAALAGSSWFAAVLPGAGGAGPALGDLLPGPGLLVLFLGYFVAGYFMYAGLYAAVGAMCSSDEEAQQAQFPLIVFLVVPIVFVAHVIEQPESALAVGLSLFPLFSPILMWARVAAGDAPVWQIVLSFGLMALAILAVARLAGRIYKAGILMTGKRPTLRELWRWVREA